MMQRALALAGALLLAACATSPPQGPQLAAPSAQEPQHLTVYAPDAKGAHQAVVLVPGCDAPLISARSALMTRYAERLRGEGFVAAILNYPAGPDCRSTTKPAAIATETAAALATVATRADVDPHRLHVLAWSWGARGALDLVTAPTRPAGLVSIDVLYPICPESKTWKSQVTLQMLMGAKDPATDACMAWAKLSDGPGPIVIHRYVGVTRGFDVDEAGDLRFTAYLSGAPLSFDASTAYQAWLDLLKFLKLDLPSA